MLILAARRVWLMVALFALVTATGSVAAWQVARPETPHTVIDLIAQPEEDDGGGVCPPGEADCEVTDEDETGGGDGDGNGDGDSNNGGGGGACTFTVSDVVAASLAAAQTTTFEVPCYLGDGVGWYDGEGCYYGDFPPIREATGGIPDPPDGSTEEDGRYYYLRCIANVQFFNGAPNYTVQTVERWEWVDFEDVPTVTPLQVAQDWLASITLTPVEPRLAPPAGTAGLIGLPVWLGVNETENSWGPIGQPHCIGEVCVTIEALVTDVDWTMGDGTTINCEPDQHEVWQRGMDFLAPGSNCHHYYQRASQYEISATSHWGVHWTADASDAEGDLTTDRGPATVSLEIDEIQVLTGR